MVSEIKFGEVFVWWRNCIFVLVHSSLVSYLRLRDQSCECSDFKKKWYINVVIKSWTSYENEIQWNKTIKLNQIINFPIFLNTKQRQDNKST